MNEEPEFRKQFITFGLAAFMFYIWGRFTGGEWSVVFQFFGALCLAFCFMSFMFSIVIIGLRKFGYGSIKND